MPLSKVKQEIEILRKELSEALQQQSATSEILRVIASSPAGIHPVLDTIAENAARVCGAEDAVIRLVEGTSLQLAAHHGPIALRRPFCQPIIPETAMGRAVLDRQVIHVDNAAAEFQSGLPESKARPEIYDARTILIAPLLREGVPVGVILIRRREVRPFTDKQIALLKTFADQAVIAIENARLFQELQAKSRELASSVRELEDKSRQLEGASRHKSQFLANVNHELRTPVSAIIGYSRLVLRETKGQIPQLQRENLQDLLNNAERLLAQIDSLLDFSKIEAGKMEVHLEPVSVDEVIGGAVSTIEPILNNDSVRLIREVAPDIPVLNTDREKLRQIILNLLGNAVKFTERGQIKVSASQQNGSLKLVVSDTGIGIEKDDLTQIFEEFHRAGLSSTKKYRGTGLGLAITKRFVNLLGGEIAVESEVGKGSIFTVVLPLDYSERD